MSQSSKQVRCGTKPKLVVILGQTATGKSELAVKLAKKFNGEMTKHKSSQPD